MHLSYQGKLQSVFYLCWNHFLCKKRVNLPPTIMWVSAINITKTVISSLYPLTQRILPNFKADRNQKLPKEASVPWLTHWNAENISLELHEESVRSHASIYLQLSQRNPTVLIHRIQDLNPRNESGVTLLILSTGFFHTSVHTWMVHVFMSYDKRYESPHTHTDNTSRVWKQTASRAAKAKCLLFVNWVKPQMILFREKPKCTGQDVFICNRKIIKL